MTTAAAVWSMSDATASIIVACIGFVGVIVTVAWRANRREHAANAQIGQMNGDKLDVITREVSYIRSDVTDIHGAITELRRADTQLHEADDLTAARVTRLERHHQEDTA